MSCRATSVKGPGVPWWETRRTGDVQRPLPTSERVPRHAVELLREDGVVNSAPLPHPEIRERAPVELPSF